jgi:hypothetical protein
MERWEPGESSCSDTDTLDQAEDEVNSVTEGRKIEWRSSRTRMGEIGEESGLRRGVVLIAVFVIGELSAKDTRLVPSLLLVRQPGIAS